MQVTQYLKRNIRVNMNRSRRANYHEGKERGHWKNNYPSMTCPLSTPHPARFSASSNFLSITRVIVTLSEVNAVCKPWPKSMITKAPSVNVFDIYSLLRPTSATIPVHAETWQGCSRQAGLINHWDPVEKWTRFLGTYFSCFDWGLVVVIIAS